MRRYRNRQDMMGYAPEPRPPMAPPSQLDPKDERLLELAERVGELESLSDLAVEDNGRLEEDNQELKSKNKKLEETRDALEEFRDKYYEAQREVDRLEQLVPKTKGGK